MSSFVAAGWREAAGAKTDQMGAVRRESQDAEDSVGCNGWIGRIGRIGWSEALDGRVFFLSRRGSMAALLPLEVCEMGSTDVSPVTFRVVIFSETSTTSFIDASFRVCGNFDTLWFSLGVTTTGDFLVWSACCMELWSRVFSADATVLLSSPLLRIEPSTGQVFDASR